MPSWPVDPAIPASTDTKIWLAFGRRLRAVGLTRDFTNLRQQDADQFPGFLQDDRLAYSAQQDTQPASLVLRLFTMDAPLKSQEVISALGEDLFNFARECELVVPRQGGWLSPFHIQLINDIYVLVDRPGLSAQTVMAMGPTTQILARASYPQEQQIDSALDLGCGCGVLALLLANTVNHVTGVDINRFLRLPHGRTIRLNRFPAALRFPAPAGGANSLPAWRRTRR